MALEQILAYEYIFCSLNCKPMSINVFLQKVDFFDSTTLDIGTFYAILMKKKHLPAFLLLFIIYK